LKRTPWFRSWFGEDYLSLYPHRDAEEAKEAVDLLHDVGDFQQDARVLDLACGGGRHLIELSRRGYRAVGLDLSIPMLRTALLTAPKADLVRGDMRAIPFASRTFDLVTSFFTSFGYFSEEYDDVRVLREVRRVLKPGGGYLLDFLNAQRVRDNLGSDDVREVDGRTVRQQRSIVEDGRIVEKRITIEPAPGVPGRVFVERVRLYEPEELDEMLFAAKLEPAGRFGSYHGDEFGPDAPRYIVMGRATL